MTATIYKIPLPEATTPTDQDALGTQLSEQGVLGSDAIVEALSSNAAGLTLTGRYALGRYHSELVATELEELADSAIGAVSLYGGPESRSGYYQIESAQVEPVHAGGRDIWEWSLSLTSGGTRSSHLRAINATPTESTSGYEFGSETAALVGVPAAARQVRALDSQTAPTQRVRPTPVDTVTTEFGDVDRYDASTISIDNPVLVYDVNPATEVAISPRAYDTRGRDSKFIEASNGRVRAWQSVYATDHEFTDGSIALSNGLLRLTLDEPSANTATGAISAERWGASSGGGYGTAYGVDYGGGGTSSGGSPGWSLVPLPASNWAPLDVDLIHIGQASIRAQIEFENTATGALYAFNLVLSRGRDSAQWFVPDGESTPAPSELVDLLSPIADPSSIDPQQTATLVARSDIRK